MEVSWYGFANVLVTLFIRELVIRLVDLTNWCTVLNDLAMRGECRGSSLTAAALLSGPTEGTGTKVNIISYNKHQF